MNRNALRTFVAAFEAGSIREAVPMVGVAQSSISRQIMRLEEELGARLLDRLPHGISPTQEGEVVIRHAREASARLERLKSELTALQGVGAGVVRIAAVGSLSQQVIPACLAGFRERHPAIGFEVLIGSNNEVTKALRERRAELGVGVNLPYESDLQTHASFTERIVAVMRPDHGLAARPLLSVADLADVRLSLPARDSPVRMMIDAVAKSRGVVLRPMLQTNSVQLQIRMASSSDFVSLLTEVATTLPLADHVLVARPLRERQFNNGSIEIVSMAGWPLTLAAEAFSQFLRNRLKPDLRGKPALP